MDGRRRTIKLPGLSGAPPQSRMKMHDSKVSWSQWEGWIRVRCLPCLQPDTGATRALRVCSRSLVPVCATLRVEDTVLTLLDPNPYQPWLEGLELGKDPQVRSSHLPRCLQAPSQTPRAVKSPQPHPPHPSLSAPSPLGGIGRG